MFAIKRVGMKPLPLCVFFFFFFRYTGFLRKWRKRPIKAMARQNDAKWPSSLPEIWDKMAVALAH